MPDPSSSLPGYAAAHTATPDPSGSMAAGRAGPGTAAAGGDGFAGSASAATTREPVAFVLPDPSSSLPGYAAAPTATPDASGCMAAGRGGAGNATTRRSAWNVVSIGDTGGPEMVTTV